MKVLIFKKKFPPKFSRTQQSRFGSVVKWQYGLQSTKSGSFSKGQLEATRRVIVRQAQRMCRVFLPLKFSVPITRKPVLTRMGRGVGPIKEYISIFKAGDLILEIGAISRSKAFSILGAASKKLSAPTKIVVRVAQVVRA